VRPRNPRVPNTTRRGGLELTSQDPPISIAAFFRAPAGSATPGSSAPVLAHRPRPVVNEGSPPAVDGRGRSWKAQPPRASTVLRHLDVQRQVWCVSELDAYARVVGKIKKKAFPVRLVLDRCIQATNLRGALSTPTPLATVPWWCCRFQRQKCRRSRVTVVAAGV
jgi:hypothetical protein